MATLSIGQLAKKAGVAIDTVRYYERNDLLEPEGRMASGYRRYGEQQLKQLRFIRRGLHALVEACPGHGRAEACPILNALQEDHP